jgi:hypothetical protein
MHLFLKNNIKIEGLFGLVSPSPSQTCQIWNFYPQGHEPLYLASTQFPDGIHHQLFIYQSCGPFPLKNSLFKGASSCALLLLMTTNIMLTITSSKFWSLKLGIDF